MRFFFIFIFLLSLFGACSTPGAKSENKEQDLLPINNDNILNQDKSTFLYINKKREVFTNGEDNYNEMILYTIDDTLAIESLREFCKSEKVKSNSGMFHILVFFDKKENAVFPNNPVTALYMDEKTSKHIKAIYTYNYRNGYSKLDYYENNYWESKANQIDIN